TRYSWQDLRLPPSNPGEVSELFHENSKISVYEVVRDEGEVLTIMRSMQDGLPFEGYPRIDLPLERTPVRMPLDEAISRRATTRAMTRARLRINDLAALLHAAYGLTDPTLRPRRTVPSGGGLYPLELFFHTAQVEGIPSGIFYFSPTLNALRLVSEGDQTLRLSEMLGQPELVMESSLLLVITALFGRNTFKYGDRGYWYTLLEAGHVAQNVNLVCAGLGLGCVNIGGFLDRRIDDFLDLDGTTHSAIYMVAISGMADASAAPV